MRYTFDFFKGPYVLLRGTYDPIIIKSGKMIHIQHVHFERGNKIFKLIIIIAKHIFLRSPILDHHDSDVFKPFISVNVNF